MALALIELPVGDYPSKAYVVSHVDVRFSAPEADALKRLTRGLEDSDAELPDGRKVRSAATALRYAMGQLADSLSTSSV